MKLLMLSVGEGRYALPADAVVRIVDPAQETEFRLEDTEATFGGGRLPFVDLHAAAGERPGPAPVYLLVSRPPKAGVLLRVDAAESIRDVAPADVAPLPDFIFDRPARLFRGVFSDGGGARLLLDEERLR